MAARTIRDFGCAFDVTPYADAWASASHFSLQSVDPDGTRHYQRGQGILTGSMLTTIHQQGSNVHMETWIHANLLARVGALFLVPAEMSVESGGIKGVLPRKICREAVNQLLAQLGQQPIP